MKRTTGTYRVTDMGGEKVRAFIPRPCRRKILRFTSMMNWPIFMQRPSVHWDVWRLPGQWSPVLIGFSTVLCAKRQ